MMNDNELGHALRASRKSWGRRGLCGAAVAMFLGFALIVDLLAFQIPRTLRGDPSGVADYVQHRTGLRPGMPLFGAAPLPDRDFAAHPLTRDERAQAARALHLTLPHRPGWTQRGYVPADMWALRPDMGHCKTLRHEDLVMRSLIGSARGCPPGLRGDGYQVYVKGDHRIAVQVRYIADNGTRPVSDLLASVKLNDLSAANFGQTGQMASARFDRSVSGWRFVRLPRREADHRGRMRDLPLRLYGRRAGHGLVDIFVLSDAPDHAVYEVIGALGYDVLAAMIAPLP